MTFKVIYNPQVYIDIQEAVDWYNEKQPGLGERFYNATKYQLNSLKKYALIFSIRYDDIHCMPLKKFPYMVHYRIDMENKIVSVEAVFSTDRNPVIWKQRAK